MHTQTDSVLTAEQKYQAFKKWKADFYEKQMKLTAEIRTKDKTKNMNPETLAKSGTEHAHQTALFAWCAVALEDTE